MKKLIILSTLIVVFITSLIVLTYQKENAKNADALRLYGVKATQLKSETVAQLTDKNYQRIITSDKLAERIANKETFYIYFFSPICPHCKRSTANVNKAFAATHATYYQYNVYEDPDAFTNFQIEGTPTTYYYKNGELADKAIGEVSDLFGAAYTYNTFKTWLEKH